MKEIIIDMLKYGFTALLFYVVGIIHYKYYYGKQQGVDEKWLIKKTG